MYPYVAHFPLFAPHCLKHFLHDNYIIRDLLSRHKTAQDRGNELEKKRFQAINQCFGDRLIGDITNSNWSELDHTLGVFNFWNKADVD